MPFKKEHPLYRTWANMLKRCLNSKTPNYPYYGGRGINVCERWQRGDGSRTGFQCFAADVGPKPGARFTIERIENDGHYEPQNVRWATRYEQQRNRRGAVLVTYRRRELALNSAIRIASAYTGLGHKVIHTRVYTMRKKGLTPQQAFDLAISLALHQGFRSDILDIKQIVP